MEAWKDIPGYEGLYQVSDMGRVRSLDRITKRNHHLKGRPIRQKTLPQRGYRLVILTDYEGSPKTWYVHALVLTTFVCSRPQGLECCHADNDPSNNNLKNLRWDTHKANEDDKILAGNITIGERNGCAKLTTEQAFAIFHDVRKYPAIAYEYRISASNVCMIKRMRTWKHIHGGDTPKSVVTSTPDAVEIR